MVNRQFFLLFNFVFLFYNNSIYFLSHCMKNKHFYFNYPDQLEIKKNIG